MAVFLAVFHFGVPFAILLSRRAKRRLAVLAGVALTILVVRLADLFYLVVPEFSDHDLRFHWMDLAAVIAVGGVWLFAFLWHLGRWPLVALNDPEVHSALARHE